MAVSPQEKNFNGKSEEKIEKKNPRPNKFQVGPGIGMVIMGAMYIWWWVMPWAWDAYLLDPRWGHNWAFALIIFTVGLAWYHKSPISRLIALFQSVMMPITAVGAFNTIILAGITLGLLVLWVVVVVIEKKKKIILFEDRFQKRTKTWLNMHSLVLAWILVGHMGLVFFFGRAPFERGLLNIQDLYGVTPGFLVYLPPEIHEYATWSYDIALTIWMFIIVYEQFKMGYNIKNKPWPNWSFWWTIIGLIIIPLIALAIQFA